MKEQMKKRNKLNLILFIVFICIIIALIVQLIPLLEDVLENRSDESSVAETVDALGWQGPVSLVGISALQVILPLIPAPAIGILSGLSYGIFWGPVIFLGGIALGNLFVFFTVHRIESIFAGKIKRKSKPKHGGILSKENIDKIKRPEIVAFFLFMIPFVSGAGPYLFAETKVKVWKYIVAVLLGSIPTAILYAIIGDGISQGSYTSSIVTASIFVAVVAVVIIFRKKLIKVIMGTADNISDDLNSINDAINANETNNKDNDNKDNDNNDKDPGNKDNDNNINDSKDTDDSINPED